MLLYLDYCFMRQPLAPQDQLEEFADRIHQLCESSRHRDYVSHIDTVRRIFFAYNALSWKFCSDDTSIRASIETCSIDSMSRCAMAKRTRINSENWNVTSNELAECIRDIKDIDDATFASNPSVRRGLYNAAEKMFFVKLLMDMMKRDWCRCVVRVDPLSSVSIGNRVNVITFLVFFHCFSCVQTNKQIEIIFSENRVTQISR